MASSAPGGLGQQGEVVGGAQDLEAGDATPRLGRVVVDEAERGDAELGALGDLLGDHDAGTPRPDEQHAAAGDPVALAASGLAVLGLQASQRPDARGGGRRR